MSSFRILLLEDDESLLEVLRDVLVEEGFEVDSCAQSDSAIHLAREKEYDLMVTDIRVDGLDGLSALSHVQSYRPSVDALVISGYADTEQAERASRLGLGAVLKKPFDLDLFLHKVNTLLQERSKKLAIQKAFESLLATSYWSTLQLARFLDSSDNTRYDFRRLVDVTGLLCSEKNLLGSHLEKIRSATIAAAWQQSQQGCSVAPPTEVPDEFEHWLSHLSEWWNGSGPKKLRGREIPIESRIIVTTLASSLKLAEAEDFEEKWPGRFDPSLLDILARQSELDLAERKSEDNKRSPESLLDLAGTFLRGGDFHKAAEVLQDVINQGAESREGVSALLLLARLRQRAGQFKEAKNMAFRAPELAKSFGPALAAHAYRESGRLLMDFSESTAASASLEKAQEHYQDLGLEAQAAECFLLSKLAKQTLLDHKESHACIELLLSPRYRNQAATLAGPLMTALLDQSQLDESSTRSLARLFLAFPVAAKLTLERATKAQQSVAVALLASVGTERFRRLHDWLCESAFPEVRNAARALTTTAGQEAGALPLHVNTLGGLVVEVGDQRIPDKAWKTSKVRYLFARLVAAYPSSVNEESLIEEFWPDDLERGRKSLYTATSSVRSALRKAGLESAEFVCKTPTGLALAQDFPLNYDLTFLRQSLDKARALEKTGNLTEAAVEYRKAALLGEWSYLPNCYNDWALQLRGSIEQEILRACVRLTQLNFQSERFYEVIEFARRAIKLDPANESATGLLLESLVIVGRPAEAMREFQLFLKTLEEELGISQATSFEEVRKRALAAL